MIIQQIQKEVLDPVWKTVTPLEPTPHHTPAPQWPLLFPGSVCLHSFGKCLQREGPAALPLWLRGCWPSAKHELYFSFSSSFILLQRTQHSTRWMMDVLARFLYRPAIFIFASDLWLVQMLHTVVAQSSHPAFLPKCFHISDAALSESVTLMRASIAHAWHGPQRMKRWTNK